MENSVNLNKELTVVSHDGIFVTDSREVAEMVGKNHKDLMRDIRGYIEILSTQQSAKLRSAYHAPKDGAVNERKIAPVDFFIESSYCDSKGETRPCYLVTKQGCEMVANKLTGEKGVLFTAAMQGGK